MHKCIPYAKIIILRFIGSWCLTNLSECMNAFPTKHPDKLQFDNKLGQAGKHAIYFSLYSTLGLPPVP